MAMRLFTREEFEKYLRDNLGLTETENKTRTSSAWETADGNYILVPILEGDGLYPDHLLDKIYEQIDKFKK